MIVYLFAHPEIHLQKKVGKKLELCGDTAYVCYTSHGCFSYKGTKNDDVAVLTCVMRRVNGRWMVMMGQRSTGRLPSEQAPQF